MDTLGPVDIVYLWVDGSDLAWRRKREAARQRLSPQQRLAVSVYGDVEGRFRDNEELRYSLRALERFFPQHGTVYIVTDGQTPAWLQDHAQLRIIDHRELIPQALLPTFDSCNIESYIHRIPGLSECYFYFNDDVFFGAPVRLGDWFWEGGVYAGWSDESAVIPGPLRNAANALDNACRLSIAWLDAHPDAGVVAGYQHTYRTFSHSPRAMRKSLVCALEHIAPDLFARVRATVFRAWDRPTIVSDFVMRWALAHGQARMRSYAHAYVGSGEAGSAAQLQRVERELGALHFFCINDTLDNTGADDPRLLQLRDSLQVLFGQASRYERLAQLA